MKFWNKNYNEMTVKELTIWSVVLGVIAYAIMWVATTAGIMAVSPEARQTVKAKYVQVKNTIRRKLEKRG